MSYRVLISAEIEGAAGVVSGLQCRLGEPEYELGRRLMTEEVNAAIEGAIEAGATEFTVCDSHANMQNLLVESLHPEARLIRGAIRDSLQMQGMDGTYDAVFITGAHAAAGTQNAVLDHTWVGASVFNIRMNGTTLNEAGLNAYVAGHYGVPVTLVTGDQATIDQTREFLPNIEGAVVKDSYSRYCASSLHPTKARAVIRQAAKASLERLGSIEPVAVADTITMEIDFYRTDMADAAALVPGIERLGARTIGFTADPEAVFRVQELVLYRLKYEL